MQAVTYSTACEGQSCDSTPDRPPFLRFCSEAEACEDSVAAAATVSAPGVVQDGAATGAGSTAADYIKVEYIGLGRYVGGKRQPVQAETTPRRHRT